MSEKTIGHSFELEESCRHMTVEEYLNYKNKELVVAINKILQDDVDNYRENAQSIRLNLVTRIREEYAIDL
jgi:hypothetical protein